MKLLVTGGAPFNCQECVTVESTKIGSVTRRRRRRPLRSFPFVVDGPPGPPPGMDGMSEPIGFPIICSLMYAVKARYFDHDPRRHGLFRPYSGTEGDELEGTGQGSVAIPAIWLIYLVTLNNNNNLNFHIRGMHICEPL